MFNDWNNCFNVWHSVFRVHHRSALVLFIWVKNFSDSEILNKKLRDSKQDTKYIITLSCKKFRNWPAVCVLYTFQNKVFNVNYINLSWRASFYKRLVPEKFTILTRNPLKPLRRINLNVRNYKTTVREQMVVRS